MKKIFLLALLIPGLCFAGDRWAKIENGKIVKFRTVESGDNIIVPKLQAHGYLPVIKSIVQKYDPFTQQVETSYLVEKEQVRQVFNITERPFLNAKEAKILKQKAVIINKINEMLDKDITGAEIEPSLYKLRTVLSVVESKVDNAGLREVEDVSLTDIAK